MHWRFSRELREDDGKSCMLLTQGFRYRDYSILGTRGEQRRPFHMPLHSCILPLSFVFYIYLGSPSIFQNAFEYLYWSFSAWFQFKRVLEGQPKRVLKQLNRHHDKKQAFATLLRTPSWSCQKKSALNLCFLFMLSLGLLVKTHQRLLSMLGLLFNIKVKENIQLNGHGITTILLLWTLPWIQKRKKTVASLTLYF